MNARPLWHLYVGRDRVLIPTVARTTAGFFLDVEPVASIPITDEPALRAALTTTLAAGNPEVPTPTRQSFPTPVVYPYAGVKSWPAFEKRFLCITLSRCDDHFEIQLTSRDSRGRWNDTPTQVERVPLDAAISETLCHVFSNQP